MGPNLTRHRFSINSLFFDHIATSQLFSDYSMSPHSSPLTSVEEVSPLYKEEATLNLGMKMPESVHYVLGRPVRSKDDISEYAETTASDSLFDLCQGRHSPLLSGDILAEARNERRYRLLLEHQFHPSRKSIMSSTGQ